MKIRNYVTGCLLALVFPLFTAEPQTRSSNNPTEIMLSIGGDPTSDYSVTWRTAERNNGSVAQIVETTGNPRFEKNAKEIKGISVPNYGDGKKRVSHQVRFTGLDPNTLYSYRVGNGKEWSEWFQFKTAKKENDKFSFIYFGDVQNDIKSLGSRTLRQAYRHLGKDASFMLFAGDLVSRSTDDYWSEFFYAGGWMLGTLPSVPATGNHEYTNTGNGRVFSHHWSNIFAMPQNAPMPEYQDRFYWFDYQGVRFIGLDSPVINKDNENLPTVLNWLEKSLGNNPNRWTIVFTHYPIYSCSSGRNSEAYRNILRPIFEKHGVDLVLQGHDHTYCRGFNNANITGNVKNPPIYVVSVAGPKMYELNSHAWSDVRGKDTQLYQNITVNNNTLYFDSYDVTGNLFDSFRLEKDSNGINKLVENPLSHAAENLGLEKGRYLASDFHNHSSYSGGDFSLGYMVDKSFEYGLDWFAESGHGGVREYYGAVSGEDLGTVMEWKDTGFKIKGDPHKDNYMWRWQSIKEYSFPEILKWRQRYPSKVIIQGFEWNVPGHEHADVGIIANQFNAQTPNAGPLAQFEYMFDNADKDMSGGKEFGWVKSTKEGHEKTLEAISWMQQNYPKQAWIIPTHPERKGRYSIADLRDMNNAGPDVCFGFDGIPGHQKGAGRGFANEDSYGSLHLNGKLASVFGGTGAFAAQIGGVWDALLSEGRKWWIFGSSDFHGTGGDFHPGEFQKNFYFAENPSDPQSIVDGLRSGNGFVVMGDLITDIRFKVNDAGMGQTTAPTDTAKIEIAVFDPETSNHNTYSNYTHPSVDHIDLIMGEVTGMTTQGSKEYTQDKVATTRVVARFDSNGGQRDANNIVSKAWKDLGNGWKAMQLEIPVNKNSYFRLRGTNNPLNTPGEVDGSGNPLPDFAKENSSEKTFSDLWFYTNPVFVKSK